MKEMTYLQKPKDLKKKNKKQKNVKKNINN